MEDPNDDGSAADVLEDSLHTKFVFMVNPDEDRWGITRVKPGTEVEDYLEDQSKNNSEWYVAALFDANVDKMVDALVLIGGGSQEGRDKIYDLIYGVIRSYEEAQINLEKWKTQRPEVK